MSKKANQSEVVMIDRWVPDYTRQCEVCDHSPVVTGVCDTHNSAGEFTGEYVAYSGTMCGACTWGEAACLNPENW